MLSNIVFEIIKSYLQDYLIFMDKQQLSMSIIDKKIEFSRANLNPSKVNEKLDELDVPFVIKAGMLK